MDLLYIWDVYYENADTDDEKRWIGTVQAVTGGEAYQKASEYFEVPSYDLVIKRHEETEKK